MCVDDPCGCDDDCCVDDGNGDDKPNGNELRHYTLESTRLPSTKIRIQCRVLSTPAQITVGKRLASKADMCLAPNPERNGGGWEFWGIGGAMNWLVWVSVHDGERIWNPS